MTSVFPIRVSAEGIKTILNARLDDLFLCVICLFGHSVVDG